MHLTSIKNCHYTLSLNYLIEFRGLIIKNFLVEIKKQLQDKCPDEEKTRKSKKNCKQYWKN